MPAPSPSLRVCPRSRISCFLSSRVTHTSLATFMLGNGYKYLYDVDWVSSHQLQECMPGGCSYPAVRCRGHRLAHRNQHFRAVRSTSTVVRAAGGAVTAETCFISAALQHQLQERALSEARATAAEQLRQRKASSASASTSAAAAAPGARHACHSFQMRGQGGSDESKTLLTSPCAGRVEGMLCDWHGSGLGLSTQDLLVGTACLQLATLWADPYDAFQCVSVKTSSTGVACARHRRQVIRQ